MNQQQKKDSVISCTSHRYGHPHSKGKQLYQLTKRRLTSGLGNPLRYTMPSERERYAAGGQIRPYGLDSAGSGTFHWQAVFNVVIKRSNSVLTRSTLHYQNMHCLSKTESYDCYPYMFQYSCAVFRESMEPCHL